MFSRLINKVVKREDLTLNESMQAMHDIIEGRLTDAQISALLTSLSMKGETIDEITGFAKVMRDSAKYVNPQGSKTVDVCGTGGDAKGTFNISTTVGFVLAGAGLKVAKHGNMAVSSKCGSADVLRVLGVNIDADIETVERCIEKANIGFIFAPLLHKAMKNVSMVRKQMGVKTIFNILGPITNPARVEYQVIGVYNQALTQTVAYVLKNLGSKHAFVVHGMDGLDEISITERTRVSELINNEIKNCYISPEDFKMKRGPLADLVVNTPEESADAIKGVLNGETGSRRDIVLLNAAAAITAVKDLDDMNEGIEIAAQSIDSKGALDSLERLIEVSHS